MKCCCRFLDKVGAWIAQRLVRHVATLTFEGKGFTTRSAVGQWSPYTTELVASQAELLGPCTILWCFGFNDHKEHQRALVPTCMRWVVEHIDATHIFVECDDGQGCSVPIIASTVRSLGQSLVSLPWPSAPDAWARAHYAGDTYHMCHAGLTEHWQSLALAMSDAIEEADSTSARVLLVCDSSFTSHDYLSDTV